MECTSVFRFLLVVFYIVTSYVEGSNKNEKLKSRVTDEKHRDWSKNKAYSKEMMLKSEEEQAYYLPTHALQKSQSAVSGDFSATSPPHLVINPSSIENNIKDKTLDLDDNFVSREYVCPYSSHCVSETLVNELESYLLRPSYEGLTKKSIIMSGHLEIASRTSDVEISDINYMGSQPSMVQETSFYTHGVSDL